MSVKTLKFGPLPSKTLKNGHTPPRADWDRFIDIPPDTRVLIVSLPGGQVVHDGLVTRSFSKDFDPGKYRYMMKKDTSAPNPGEGEPGRCLRVEGEFLIDLTEEQWRFLSSAQPKAHRAAQTSEGPMWICRACNRKSQTRVAAFLHEAQDHYGIDPLKNPERVSEIELQGQMITASQTQAKRAAFGATDGDVLNEMAEST